MLSCLGSAECHNLANSILSGSSGDEREGPTALFFGHLLTPWPLGFLHGLAVGGLRKAGQRGGHLFRQIGCLGAAKGLQMVQLGGTHFSLN